MIYNDTIMKLPISFSFSSSSTCNNLIVYDMTFRIIDVLIDQNGATSSWWRGKRLAPYRLL